VTNRPSIVFHHDDNGQSLRWHGNNNKDKNYYYIINGFGAYGSVVRGDARDDEHEVEGDDELDDERLHVGARRDGPEEVLPGVPEQQPQRQARRRGAHHLRRRVRGHLLPGEPPAGGERDGDGRVQVRAGDVADGVHHHHHGQPPHDADARERHRAPRPKVHRHRRAPREDEEVGPQDLRDDLHQNHTSPRSHHTYGVASFT